jgi:hypothetical protein
MGVTMCRTAVAYVPRDEAELIGSHVTAHLPQHRPSDWTYVRPDVSILRGRYWFRRSWNVASARLARLLTMPAPATTGIRLDARVYPHVPTDRQR